MTDNVVSLESRRPKGNGAREALIEYYTEHYDETETPDPQQIAEWVDQLLATMWHKGFKIVPLGPEDAA